MKYYIARDNRPVGPFELRQLPENGVTASTLLWRSGLSTWLPADQIPEVKHFMETGDTPPEFDQRLFNERFNPAPRSVSLYDTPRWQHIDPTKQFDYYPCPNNYLAEAIVATLFCFPVTGIVAIVNAVAVNRLYAERRYEEAERKSKAARNWVIGSVALGVLFFIYLFF